MTTLFEHKPKVRPGATGRLPAPDHFTTTGPRLLAEAVQAAVHRVDENTLKPVARHEDGQAVRPKILLALLSFCYARQTYGSAEVVDWLRRDANFRQFSHNEFPDARSLCRFRRENRELLHRCLTATLRFLVERKVAAGIVTKVSEAQLAEEASRRIIMAMFMDSLELEPEAPSDAPVDLCYLFAKGRPLAH
jgi:transposase